MKNYFTKTMFRRALECPTSVYYQFNKGEYINTEDDNDFVKAIMEGGYQVEYLAKDYFPSGIDLSELPVEENIKQTEELIKSNTNIILFEPAFVYNGFLVRVDILEKNGNDFKIMEVKAKGFDFSLVDDDIDVTTDNLVKLFINSRTLKKDPKLKKEWEHYVLDAAFQKYVLSSVYPDSEIETNLFLLNKQKQVSVNGLHQKYLVRDNKVFIKEGMIGESIMDLIPLDGVFEIAKLFDDDNKSYMGTTFSNFINYMKNNMLRNEKVITQITSKCKLCPYYTMDEIDGKKNGFVECWTDATKLPKETLLKEQTVLDVWNYRNKDKDINDNVYMLKDIDLFERFDGVEFNESKNNAFDTKTRQLVQIESVINKSNDMVIYEDGLKEEINSWKYPLHLIDFETSSPAIPFNIHLKPYESLLFQYSHHVLHEDGRVEHKGEYLHSEQGTFPSFKTLRELKNSLEGDDGSVFMYSPHENSILNHILRQLHTPLGDLEDDKDDLVSFIKTITKSNDRSIKELTEYAVKNGDISEGEKYKPWIGDRCLIDLWDVLKKYYYNPLTLGSNSIKYVLPAVIESSSYLRDKYSQSIYGSDILPSKNFKDKIWLKFDDNGKIINPYKQLPALFDDDENMSDKLMSNSIANGGEAMTAFSRLNYVQMSDNEREKVVKAMLSYCELDTLGMVMIIEHWVNDIINKNIRK